MKRTVVHERVTEYETGFGVAILPIYEGEDENGNESDRIVEIETFIVWLFPWNEVIRGEVLCMKVRDMPNWAFPVTNFRDLEDFWEDDTHDFRDRWFATLTEAESHARNVEESFRNPLPWQSFVSFS